VAIDNTRGEIKMVRGSGPPILTVEGESVAIADVLFPLSVSRFAPSLPLTATVIGIDLTRRTVRLQVIGGREILYCAESSNGRDSYFLFGTADLARHNAVTNITKAVASKEEAADRAIDELEKTKRLLSAAEQWSPTDGTNGVEVEE
jgi:hypothetical protein